MQDVMRRNIHIKVYTSVIPTSTAIAIVIKDAETEYSRSLYVAPSLSMLSVLLVSQTMAWSAAARSMNANMAHFTLKFPD